MRFVLLLSLFFTFTFAVHPVSAASVVGTGTPESCTEATFAEAVALGGEITFNCGTEPLVIAFTTEKLITLDTTIDGGGLVTLDGSGVTRLLNSSATLTVRNITFTNGFASTGGGAITSGYRADLTIENVRFLNNTVTFNPPNGGDGGGAVHVSGSILTIRNTEFTGNKVQSGGGGAVHSLYSNVTISDSIFNSNQSSKPGLGGAFFGQGIYDEGLSGSIIIQRTTFIGNEGQGQGGAVFTYLDSQQIGSVVVIEESSFIANRVTLDDKGDSFGGALRHGNGTLTITKSLFSQNNSQSQGGAVWLGENTNTKLVNVTISGNSAVSTDGKSGFGGGITVASIGPTIINNSTIAYNRAGFLGGGVSAGTADITLRNTIIAHNSANNEWNINQNCTHSMHNGGNNIQNVAQHPYQINDHECAEGITVGDPLLNPLADNGGPTQTHALTIGSIAIDSGNSVLCEVTDQRNTGRVGICDVGAYEYDGAAFVMTELLANGGFEIAGSSNKLAENWKAKNVKGDRRICNKPPSYVAFQGNCAFRLKGGAGKNSSISQKITPQNMIAGDQLVLSLWANASELFPGAQVQVKVKYLNTATEVMKLDITGPNMYRRMSSSITLDDVPTKILTKVQMQATTGQLLIDELRLAKVDILNLRW
jgi:hypothetical protein